MEGQANLDEIPITQNIDGPGDPGLLTQEAGLLSYPEVCNKLEDPAQSVKGVPSKNTLKKVTDITKKKGTFLTRHILIN